MMSREERTAQANALAAELIKNVGERVASFNSYGEEMITTETLTLALLLSAATRHNRHPLQAAEMLYEGIKRRLKAFLIGSEDLTPEASGTMLAELSVIVRSAPGAQMDTLLKQTITRAKKIAQEVK